MTVLAVSLGCPAGIGPEVAVVAAAEERRARCVLVGDPRVVRRAAAIRGIRADVVEVGSVAEARAARPGALLVWAGSARLAGRLPAPGRPGGDGGRAQLAWVDQALAIVVAGGASALVTGPVSKAEIAASGAPGAKGFRGHTEHLADRLGAAEVVMAFWSKPLTTALVTTHLPLRRVPDAIDREGVARTTYWLGRLLHDLGAARPRLAVAGLNPHAGEGGLLGDEERAVIGPGARAGAARLAASGVAAAVTEPMGAESAYRLAARGAFDGVVAMYHDQATIPSKLLSFGEAVNVTLGLPVIRTSVDHGTAYDRAGAGDADAGGMVQAVKLAVRLSARRR